jgi:hypothetical protein
MPSARAAFRHGLRGGPRRGERRQDGAQAEARPASEARIECRHWPELKRVGMDDFEAIKLGLDNDSANHSLNNP